MLENNSAGELLPEYRVTFIRDPKLNRLEANIHDAMIRLMHIKDTELASRLVIDDENPDYIIASDTSLWFLPDCEKLRDYMRRRRDGIFIYFTDECIEPDLNLFDYAFTWNPDLFCGDRINHNEPYIYRHQDELVNDLTPEEARRILDSHPSFCNFIYSHPNEPRDSFFQLLSQYKHVDSSGRHLNNTATPSTRHTANWYELSVKMKLGYKFSIAMENASCKGYTTEKLITSLQAHNVPIYWGDPEVSKYINPKAFINISDYSSFEEAIERVKEIDNNDDLWLDMVTQPWQTEEQRDKIARMIDESNAFIRHIFTQDIKKARRRIVGYCNDWCIYGFTGLVGIMPPYYLRAARKIRRAIGKRLPPKIKSKLKKFLHMN